MIASLAAGLAQSFTFSPARFRQNYPAPLAADDARPLLAADGEEPLGYLLGFRHLAFYASGPVGWVEEVFVRRQDRGRGVGRALASRPTSHPTRASATNTTPAIFPVPWQRRRG